ncbi:hypothetical protein [Nocardiopsis sp. NPDC006938]|uniref:hypothetical protein n=1 Tax=Nocardiopsis sp. NPDC006938 TaxID=3364337 RepID=UPI0036A57F5F
MDTKAKPEAVELTMERASSLTDLLPAPLVFRGADAAVSDSPPPGTEAGEVYTATARYVCAVGPNRVNDSLRKLHSDWRARGWESSIRAFDGGGEVTVRTPDGFSYFVTVRADHRSLAVMVDSPLYRDPAPDTLFTPLRPG